MLIVQVDVWAGLPELAVLPLMHAAFNDAKCPDDVAVRSAATAALTRFVDAAAASTKARYALVLARYPAADLQSLP